jgi:hypothetical protein
MRHQAIPRILLAIAVGGSLPVLMETSAVAGDARFCRGADIVGTSNRDIIRGTPGRDVIRTFAGNTASRDSGGTIGSVVARATTRSQGVTEATSSIREKARIVHGEVPVLTLFPLRERSAL